MTGSELALGTPRPASTGGLAAPSVGLPSPDGQPVSRALRAACRHALAAGLLLWLQLSPVWAGPALPLRFGWDSDIMAGVSSVDAKAATRVWVRIMVNQKVVNREPTVSVFDTARALGKAVASNQVDVVTVASVLYLTMPESRLLTPKFVGLRQGEVVEGSSYLLLARPQAAAGGLKGLRKKSVLIAVAGQTSLPALWLEVLLRRAGLENSREFFTSAETVAKAPQALLPVLFGKADCCVVSRTGFEVAKELNPQLGRELKVMAASSPLRPGVLCVRKSWTDTAANKRALDESMVNLRKHSEGRQIMALYGVQRMVPYQPLHLAGVVSLLAECRKLGVPISTGN